MSYAIRPPGTPIFEKKPAIMFDRCGKSRYNMVSGIFIWVHKMIEQEAYANTPLR